MHSGGFPPARCRCSTGWKWNPGWPGEWGKPPLAGIVRLTVEQMKNQMDPVYTPARKTTCTTATIAACRWRSSARKGNSVVRRIWWMGQPAEWWEPAHLQQLIRLPGQQYDEESGLFTTATAIMTRCRSGISLRIRWAEGGMEFLSVSVESGHKCSPQGLVDINLYPESDLIHSVVMRLISQAFSQSGGMVPPHLWIRNAQYHDS